MLVVVARRDGFENGEVWYALDALLQEQGAGRLGDYDPIEGLGGPDEDGYEYPVQVPHDHPVLSALDRAGVIVRWEVSDGVA